MFPFERFLRAGATFDEAGALGARYGKNTTRFDGAADGELRRVIDEHRDRQAGAMMDEEQVTTLLPDDEPDSQPGRDDEPQAVQGDDGSPETATEGKGARNQSRPRRASE